MSFATDFQTAIVTAQKNYQASQTAANAQEVGRLVELSNKIADLKQAAARITSAGGVLNSTALSELNTLVSQL
jgi:spore coat polysaccharide biosynthesis predicted glycosyltransferase SpsG